MTVDPSREGEVAALRLERAGYLARGLQDRAAQVVAVLEALGVPLLDDERDSPDHVRPQRRRKTT